MAIQFSTSDLQTPESVERVLRQFQRAIETQRETPQAAAVPSIGDLVITLSPLIRQELQAPGTAPMDLTALINAPGLPVVLEDTHPNRLLNYPAASYQPGTLFFEIDRQILYILYAGFGGTAPTWAYLAGMQNASFASRATDLGTSDNGYLMWIRDQAHLFRWSGTVWHFVDGEGGYIVDRISAPTDNGWQLCDGTATDYLQISGGDIVVTAFTTPDEVTAPSGVYHKSIAAYTGTINAAAAPALSGSTAAASTGVTTNAEAAHTHAVTSPTGTPSATVEVQSGTGTTVATDTHTHSITSPTGSGSSHSHGITDPTHTHGTGTLVADATGQPRNMGVLRYFRR